MENYLGRAIRVIVCWPVAFVVCLIWYLLFVCLFFIGYLVYIIFSPFGCTEKEALDGYDSEMILRTEKILNWFCLETRKEKDESKN
jgi:hypothetical protein